MPPFSRSRWNQTEAIALLLAHALKVKKLSSDCYAYGIEQLHLEAVLLQSPS